MLACSDDPIVAWGAELHSCRTYTFCASFIFSQICKVAAYALEATERSWTVTCALLWQCAEPIRCTYVFLVVFLFSYKPRESPFSYISSFRGQNYWLHLLKLFSPITSRRMFGKNHVCQLGRGISLSVYPALTQNILTGNKSPTWFSVLEFSSFAIRRWGNNIFR